MGFGLYLCPNCNGQKTVSKPPYIAGDVHEWTGTGEHYPCPTCNSKGYIALEKAHGERIGELMMESQERTTKPPISASKNC